MALSMQVNADGSKLHMLALGFTGDDISRTGDLAFWKLGEHFQFGRGMMITHPDAFSDGVNHIFHHCTVFSVAMEYNISKEMYKKARRYQSEYSKLRHVTELTGVGKSSMYLRTTIFEPDSERVLGSLDLKYVGVDRETRRSVRHPQWFVEKYRKYTPGEHMAPYNAAIMPSDPSKVYKKGYQVLPSDTDQNKHMNNTVYYRLCLDAASEASVNAKLFQNFPGDIGKYLVKSSKCVYPKECQMGDIIDVFVWEDTEADDAINCQITKGDQTVFHCRIVFHKPLQSFKARL